MVQFPGSIIQHKGDDGALLRPSTVSDDGTHMIATPDRFSGDGSNLFLVEVATSKILYRFDRSFNYINTCLDSTGRFAALVRRSKSGMGDEVCIHSLPDGKITAIIPIASDQSNMRPFTHDLQFSPDGKLFAIHDQSASKVSVYELSGSGVVFRPTTPRNNSDLLPVPDEAKVKEISTILRDIYKTDYQKKTPADRKALALKLIEDGNEAKKNDEKYVYYLEAKDLFQEALAGRETCETIQRIADLFRVNALELNTQAFEKLTPAIPVSGTKELLEIGVALFDEEFSQDNYENAEKYAQLLLPLAKRSGVAASIKEMQNRFDQATKASTSFQQLKPFLETLKTKPDDPEANLETGKYRCFRQRRWDEGLPLLAKGSDATLKAAAMLDLKFSKDGTPDLTVADGWWDLAQKAEEAERSALESRARHWYYRLAEKLTGIQKRKAELKLVISQNGVDYHPGLNATFQPRTLGAQNKIASRIDPAIDFRSDEWVDNVRRKVEFIGKWNGNIVPAAPGRYTLVANTTAPVRVTLNGIVVINTLTNKNGNTSKSVILSDKTNTLLVEGLLTSDDGRSLKLQWQPPGATDPTGIPAEFLYHAQTK